MIFKNIKGQITILWISLLSPNVLVAGDIVDPIESDLDNVIKMHTSLNSLIPYQEGKAIKDGDPVKYSPDGAINLSQGWTNDSQQEFYFTSQGSQILPYRWYLFLEQANSNELFRSDDNIRRYAYLPSKKSPQNPDGLSIGIAKDTDEHGEEWMGFNCAACHTTEVSFKSAKIRIDGGPTMADFQTFNVDLVSALQATLNNENKFKRFSNNVLTGDKTPAELKEGVIKQTAILNNRNKINVPHAASQPAYGYARLDAIGAIFNQVFSVFNDDPLNARAANAPVSYPFIWGTHQSDVVQWTGFAPNGPLSLGALIRNGGEVLGVYGNINIGHHASNLKYPSSLDFEGLGLLEARVAQLRSPAWPSALPSIDLTKKAAGEKLYKENCASCHQVIARKDEGQNYKAILTPLSELGTDSQEILNLLGLRNGGDFTGRKEGGIAGAKIGYVTTGLDPLVNSVVGSIFDQPEAAFKAAFVQYIGGVLASQPDNGINVSLIDREKFELKTLEKLMLLKKSYSAAKKVFDECEKNKINNHLCTEFLGGIGDLVKDGVLVKDVEEDFKKFVASKGKETEKEEVTSGQVYKARPLNGIWATAPYLHNGSVLSLMELLLTKEERLASFHVGSREIDPVNVGFVNKKTPNSSLLDTSLLGNSNSGHEFGTALSKREKLDLVEYMKTL